MSKKYSNAQSKEIKNCLLNKQRLYASETYKLTYSFFLKVIYESCSIFAFNDKI